MSRHDNDATSDALAPSGTDDATRVRDDDSAARSTTVHPAASIVTSADGTPIVYDKLGSGPTLILVAGAFSYRRFPMSVRIATALAEHYTVINYDRRGRGDSGDMLPYAVEREIEDLDALIQAHGGSTRIWGLSSGGVLALRAAASGLDIERLAVYQPPFVVDTNGHIPPPDLAVRLAEAVAADRRSDAVRLFMTGAFGVPAFFVTLMRVLPMWKRLVAVANTLPYDLAVMGDTIWGTPLDPTAWGPITTPTLVMDGGASPARVREGARALAAVLPNASQVTLPRCKQVIKPDALRPALKDFFG